MNGANKDETGDDQDAEKGVLFIAVSRFGLGFCFNTRSQPGSSSARRWAATRRGFFSATAPPSSSP
jgi:hypothetical protein